MTGIALLISIVAGAFGELFVPTRIVVTGDAAATAKNMVASAMLFRLGFAGYLVEAVCDISLTLLFYLLLKPVRRDLALLAAFLRLVSTATFAVAEFFYFASSIILGGTDYLKTFTPDQVSALALLSLDLYGYGGGLFMVFHGAASVLLGYLMFQSGYIPKFLGALFALAGVGFVLKNFTLVLAPEYASDFLLFPMFLAMLSMALWFVVRGVDVSKWRERATPTYG
jgi:hypothetical protein